MVGVCGLVVVVYGLGFGVWVRVWGFGFGFWGLGFGARDLGFVVLVKKTENEHFLKML